MKIYNTSHEAYLGSLEDVLNNPEYISAPRGQKVREKLDYSFKILNPSNEPLVTKDLERNAVIKSYTEKEVELYNSGTNRVEDFAKASKFWTNLANPDGTVNSAYGHLIWNKFSHGSDYEKEHIAHPLWEDGTVKHYVPVRRTPWQWCLESLKNDKDTRQAVLRFALPEHHWKGNKDFTCTLNGNFLIRDNKLHLSVVMRSNDLMLGLVYDLPWFCSLMDKMIEDLKDTYPELEKGSYTHFVHSLHIYERDIDKIKKMLGHDS